MRAEMADRIAHPREELEIIIRQLGDARQAVCKLCERETSLHPCTRRTGTLKDTAYCTLGRSRHRATEGRIDTLGKLDALRDARNIIAAQCAGFPKGSYLARLQGPSKGIMGSFQPKDDNL